MNIEAKTGPGTKEKIRGSVKQGIKQDDKKPSDKNLTI